jgi:hypothetical protein
MNKEIELKANIIFNKHSWAALGAISTSKHFCIAAMCEMYNEALKGIDLERVVSIPTWVKASERPIPSNPDIIIRRISTKEIFPYEWVNACINVGTWVEGKYSPSDYEWLDESGKTTIGELIHQPYK